jgi:hypothetical protein
MTIDKVRRVMKFYCAFLKELGVTPYRFIVEEHEPEGNQEKLMHLAGLIEDSENLLNEGRLEKAFRWLGFVQGALWILGFFKIKDLKSHSRPDSRDENDWILYL